MGAAQAGGCFIVLLHKHTNSISKNRKIPMNFSYKISRIKLIIFYVIAIAFVYTCWFIFNLMSEYKSINRQCVISTFSGRDIVMLGEKDSIKYDIIKRSGDYEGSPLVFKLNNENFIYWDKIKNTCNIVSIGAKKNDVTIYVGNIDHVKKISFDNKSIVLMTEDTSYFIDIKNTNITSEKGQWLLVNNNPVKSVALDNNKFILDEQNGLKYISIDKITDHSSIRNWDYDYINHKIYVVDTHHQLFCIDSETKKIDMVRLPDKFAPINLMYQPIYDEIWIYGIARFHSTIVICLDNKKTVLGILKSNDYYYQALDNNQFKMLKNYCIKNL